MRGDTLDTDTDRYSGLNLNQDKATKPQTVQIVRQGEATPYWFKVNPLYFQAITDILSIQQKRFPNLFFYILIFDNIFPLIPFVIS